MDGSTLEGIIHFLVGDGIGAQSVFVLALTIAIGLAIGQIKFWKLSLGVSGVLFSSLLLGNSGVELDQDILLFTRDFGLILFIFSVGLQVGPGFTDSLRQGGLALNALSAGIVAAGFALVLLFAFWFGSSPAALIGLFSGGTTSTPALAAATQTAGELVDKEELALVNLDLGLGYALAYPFGVIGVIIAMLLIRVIGRIDIANEMKSLEEILHRRHSAMHIRNLKLTNANLIGKHLSSIPGLEDMGVTISRVMDDGHVYPADPEMELKEGMIVHVVGDAEQLDRAELIIGPPVASKLRASHGHLEIRSLLVTNSRAIGSTLRALQLTPEHGVTVTRIRRSGMELGSPPQHAAALRRQAGLRRVAASHGPRGTAPRQLHKNVQHAERAPYFCGYRAGRSGGQHPLRHSRPVHRLQTGPRRRSAARRHSPQSRPAFRGHDLVSADKRCRPAA